MKRFAISGLACFAAIAVAVAATLSPVTIKRTPSKGQKLSYSVSGKVSLSGMEFDITNKQTDTITDVAADGTFTTESLQSDMQLNGSPSPQQPTGPSTIKAKPDGSIISITGPEGASDQGRLAALTSFYYPSKPVDVNDTWSFEGKKDDKLGNMDFKSDMKYLGEEKVGTVDTYKVDVDAKETTPGTPASLHSTVWLDVTDGSMVKVVSNFTNMPVQAGITVDGSLTYTRN